MKDEETIYSGVNVYEIKDNKLAVPTGYYGKSGYCCYPEYKFDLPKLYG